MAIMKKLAGTTWGANSSILKQVYTGAVRPIVEYASPTWAPVAKSNTAPLDKVRKPKPKNSPRRNEKHTYCSTGKTKQLSPSREKEENASI